MKDKLKRLVLRYIGKNAILSILFNRNIKEGQYYMLRDAINSGNPFKFNKSRKYYIVEILKVKGKWINYRYIGNAFLYQDESMERTSFNYTFMKYTYTYRK